MPPFLYNDNFGLLLVFVLLFSLATKHSTSNQRIRSIANTVLGIVTLACIFVLAIRLLHHQ